MKLHIMVCLLFKAYAHSKQQPVALRYRHTYRQTLTPQERRLVSNVSPKSISYTCKKQKCYAAIDAWIPGIGTFHMMAGEKHCVKVELEMI